jgi:tetratricopeptide (TPR) repeat protein
MQKQLNPSEEIDTLLHQSLRLHQENQVPKAILGYQKVLKHQPNHADALNLMGIAHLDQNKPKNALDFFNEALKADPTFKEAYLHSGLALQRLNQHQEAINCFKQVLSLSPRHIESWLNLGNSYYALAQYQDASHAYEETLRLSPQHPFALTNLANTLHQLGQTEKAVELLLNISQELNTPEQLPTALHYINHALHIAPQKLDLLFYRGTLFFRQQRYTEALNDLDQLLTYMPDNGDVLSQKGVVLQAMRHYEEALSCYQQVLRKEPHRGFTLLNTAKSLHELGRFKESLKIYEIALPHCTNIPTALFSYALSLLLTGNFKKGWAYYENRWYLGYLKTNKPHFEQAMWLNDFPLQNRTILIEAEQGTGDIIQFCRLLEPIKQKGAHVILRVPTSLKNVLKSLKSVDQLIDPNDPLPAFDCYCPLMSLPLALGIDLHTLTSTTLKSYLSVDPIYLDKWRPHFDTKKPIKIGICWSGNQEFGDDDIRSIPFSLFSQITIPNVEFFCLQKEIHPTDLNDFNEYTKTNPKFHFLGNELNDYSDTAALIHFLDLIITVDTGVAHLSCALGKPTWILLSFVPDWRWLLNRDDSPWYPSARLFRQTKTKQWEDSIHQIKNELSILASILS